MCGPSLRAESSLIDIVQTALLVALSAILLTLVVPAVIAFRGGVYYHGSLVQKLPNDAQVKLARHTQEKTQLETQLVLIDRRLSPASPDFIPTNVDGLLKDKADLRSRLDNLKPPVVAVEFHLNPQLLLWPAIYTALGLLVTIFRPPAKVSFFRLIGLMCCIYVLYEWPLWIRNFVLSSEGRVVYAYPNFDIHPASFIAQEGQVLGFCFLVALLWLQWIAAAADVRREIRQVSPSPIVTTLDSRRMTALADEFIAWQVNSVALGLGFLFFTQFFWNLVGALKDQRYLLSAMLAHAVWGVSWILLSMPVVLRWRAWSGARLQAMTLVAKKKAAKEDDEGKLWDLLRELQPLSAIGMSISGAAAAASFVWPIIKSLF